jgi:peptide/nickel transport system substrate-binding protein
MDRGKWRLGWNLRYLAEFLCHGLCSDPFTAIENGTGPFKLDSLKQGEEYVLSRFDDYWAGPAKLERVVAKAVPEAGTRFAMLETGDADAATVQVADRAQVDELVGERCEFDIASNAYKPCEVTDDSKPLRLYIGRPQIFMDVMLTNWNIATTAESPNPYLGSGKLDGNGIPSDFFADVHIRKAFGYCFDWDTLINDVYRGEAIQPVGLPLAGMPGYFPDTPHYTTDLDKCAEEFKLADLDKDGIPAGDDPEGDVWTNGFRVQMAYNQGSQIRQTVAEILAGNLATVNELFSLETLGLPWASYLRSQRAKQLPIMTGGWQEDIHDPHNWYQPYTTGTYGARQSLPDELKAQFKEILERGVAETDPAKRAEIYKEANQLYYDQAVGIPLDITTSHGYRQRWVQGEILNPIFPGFYYYTMFKD